MGAKRNEVVANGVAASPGIAMGNALVLARTDIRVPKRRLLPEETDGEIERLVRAVEATKAQLAEIRDRVAKEMVKRGKISVNEAKRILEVL